MKPNQKINNEGETRRLQRQALRVELNRFRRQGFSRRGKVRFESGQRIGSDATFMNILNLLDLLGRAEEKKQFIAHKAGLGLLYISKPLPKIAA
jgi:hypothetical protein